MILHAYTYNSLIVIALSWCYPYLSPSLIYLLYLPYELFILFVFILYVFILYVFVLYATCWQV